MCAGTFLMEKLFLAKVQIFSKGHIFKFFSWTQHKNRNIFSNVFGLLRKYEL